MRTLMKLLELVLLCAGICCAQGRSALSPSVRNSSRSTPQLLFSSTCALSTARAGRTQRSNHHHSRARRLSPSATPPASRFPQARRCLTSTAIRHPRLGGHARPYVLPAPNGPPAMYPEHATSFPRLYLAGGVKSHAPMWSDCRHSACQIQARKAGGVLRVHRRRTISAPGNTYGRACPPSLG